MSNDSKFLSLVLRHDPERIGIKLDRQGWVQVEDLLRNLKRIGRVISREELELIVETNDKRRFTLSDDGLRIRAAQGHSVDIDLGLASQKPPENLYHGTARANLDKIFVEGLKPRGRQQVHLSLDPEAAKKVGQRHGKPTVLRVESGRMYEDDFQFFRSDNGVWLTDVVPPEYLSFGIT